jgi:hypothetical protein
MHVGEGCALESGAPRRTPKPGGPSGRFTSTLLSRDLLRWWAVAFAVVCWWPGQAAWVSDGPPPVPSPPAVRQIAPAAKNWPVLPKAEDKALTLYSIGEPTDNEQWILELVNRSRANPPAEGLRLRATTDPQVLSAYSYFGVDLNLMVSQFNAIPSVPPLSFSSNLIYTARNHSYWMFLNNVQAHNEGTLTPDQRLTAAGYNWWTMGENIAAYSESPWYGHASLNVDWGYGTGGMQTPPGHRENIHDASFREVGVGIYEGSYGTDGSVGPMLITQDFGARSGGAPLVTGVAYYDLNNNGFYDAGEGIGGVTVNVSGSTYYAVTAGAGGYSVPSANGSRTVTFSGTGWTSTQQVVTVANGANVKVDFVPVYRPPTIRGTNQPQTGQDNAYTFSAVPGATNYQWRSTRRALLTAVEGAENGLANVTTDISSGYSVVVTDVKYQGNASFHLAQPAPPRAQYLLLNRLLRARTNAQLRFASRLGWATSCQVARAQISTNGGAAWIDLWSQAGTSTAGDSSFKLRTNALAAYAGCEFQVRFVYDFLGSSYYYDTDSGCGLCLDEIAFDNVEELTSPSTNLVATTNFTFHPAQSGEYSLRVRPKISNRYFDYGPETLVTATNSPVICLARPRSPGPGQCQIEFTTTNLAPAAFVLLRANPVTGAYSPDPGAVLRTNTPGSSYRFTTTNGGSARWFYRVKAP